MHRLTELLRLVFIREARSYTCSTTLDTAAKSESSKLGLLAMRIQHPGPPLHVLFDGIAIPGQRAALASLLCADWYFGKYAKNYYAKNLLPRTNAHLTLMQDAGVEEGTVCLACWHYRRVCVLEDEFHVTCACPEHMRARQHMLDILPANTKLNNHTDLCKLLALRDPTSLSTFGRFLECIRQQRRKS